MNAFNVKPALVLVLTLSLTGGLWMQQALLQNRSPANREPATAAETARYAIAKNPAVYAGASGPAYTATVTARSSNALEAKFMLEQQINAIARHARNQGGGIRSGETHYRRIETTDGSPKTNRSHEFVIVQRIRIVFPAEINRARAEAQLARLAVNGVRIDIPD